MSPPNDIERFDPYHRWLGIPPKDQPPNHYRLLGVELFEADPDVIENAADKQTVHLRTFQLSKYRDLAEELLNEVASARICLLNPPTRAIYDAQLREQLQRKTADDDSSEDRFAGQMAEVLAAVKTPASAMARRAPRLSPLPLLLGGGAVVVAAVVLFWAIFAKPAADSSQQAVERPVVSGPGAGTKVQGPARGGQTGEPQSSSVAKRSQTASLTPAGRHVEEKPPVAPPKSSAGTANHIVMNSIGMKLVPIPAGEFMMGSTSEEVSWALEEGRKNKESQWCLDTVPTEAPRHRVKITKSFFMGVHYVTQAEYEKVMGVNPSTFTEKPMSGSGFKPPLDPQQIEERENYAKTVAGADTSRHPVETVSWDDCVEFCRRLSAMPDERTARRVYRLPTEAEWEYACRAGTTTRWYCGDDEAGLIAAAWVGKNSRAMTHPVGEKKPNAWGLYDMHKNLFQWCADWFGRDYYKQSPASDPTGPNSGSARVMRGGDWMHAPSFCRSAYRGRLGPGFRSPCNGFRLAMDIAPTTTGGSGGQTANGTQAVPTPNRQSPTPPPATKQAVPDEVTREKALKAAQERFKTEWDRAQTPAEKKVLAQQLLRRASDAQNGAADKFVFLELARDVAAAAGDWDTVQTAINRLAEAFVVDRFEIASGILTTWARQPQNSTQRSELVETILGLADEAINAAEPGAAEMLCKLATSEAAKIRSKALTQRVRACKQRLSESAPTMKALKQARTALAANPSDADANLIVGRQLCFTKGDWEKGLPLLSLGSDETLRTLAKQELSVPGNSQGQLKLADAWWDVAQAATGTPKDRLMLHAGRRYDAAIGSVPSGLARAKIEKRLTEIAKIRARLPSPPPAIAPFDSKRAREHQEAWANYLGAAVEETNSIGMKLALIPPGEFTMGSTPEEIAKVMAQAPDKWQRSRIASEAPQHRVNISRSFYLGVYPVTQGQYQQVMGNNPSSFSAKGNEAAMVVGKDTAQHPAEMVSWDDAVEFCRRLSSLPDERGLGRTYRLPTEAEWEYSCRAGTTTRWSCGDDEVALMEYAWLGKNSGKMTHPVGEKKPNAWGLYDMHGNVLQWCSDYNDPAYYKQSPTTDPTGPELSGRVRVARGGRFLGAPSLGRSAFRESASPADRFHHIGFRVAVDR
jgi:formylglycine-generating enzyme required for sulfatase activity